MRPAQRRKQAILIATICVLGLVATPVARGEYTVVNIVNGGVIRGAVRWAGGAIPIPVTHTVVKNRDFCGNTVTDDSLTSVFAY